MEMAKCCATCKRGVFVVIAQKVKDTIHTGISSHGKCYQKKYPQSCRPNDVCEKHIWRDDIFSADQINLN
jgi:hypothetical protein